MSIFGVGVANLAFLAVGLGMSTADFMTWGWRIPFLASIVLVGVGLWIRHRVPETEEFRELEHSGRIARAPLIRMVRESTPEIVLTALLKSAEMIPVYIFITFILSYGTRTLSYDRNTLLLLVSLAAVIAALTMPVIARYGDRAGHRHVFMAGAVAVALFTFAYFRILDSGSAVGAPIMIVLSLVPCAAMIAVEPVLITGSFPPEIRYSGASLGFNLAGVIGGGPAVRRDVARHACQQHGNRRLCCGFLSDRNPGRPGIVPPWGPAPRSVTRGIGPGDPRPGFIVAGQMIVT